MEREIVRDKVTLDHDGYIIPVEEYEMSAEELESVRQIVNESKNLVELCAAVYVEGRRSVLTDEDFDRECSITLTLAKLKHMERRKLDCVTRFVSGLS